MKSKPYPFISYPQNPTAEIIKQSPVGFYCRQLMFVIYVCRTHNCKYKNQCKEGVIKNEQQNSNASKKENVVSNAAEEKNKSGVEVNTF